MEKIIKRDGRQVNFDRSKIEEAILRAFVSVDGDVSEYAEQKAEKIADFIEEAAIETEEPYTVEEIQDMVEKGLMSTKRKDVAKSYILYRQERNRKRNINSKLMQDMKDKLLANNIENQNANVDEHSFGGRKGEADSEDNVPQSKSQEPEQHPLAHDKAVYNAKYQLPVSEYGNVRCGIVGAVYQCQSVKNQHEGRRKSVVTLHQQRQAHQSASHSGHKEVEQATAHSMVEGESLVHPLGLEIRHQEHRAERYRHQQRRAHYGHPCASRSGDSVVGTPLRHPAVGLVVSHQQPCPYRYNRGVYSDDDNRKSTDCLKA